MNKRRTRKPKGEKVLRPIHPNVGIERAYQRKLDTLVQEMQDSVVYWLTAAYRANEPRLLAQDETPADALRRSIKDLAKRWLRKFDIASVKLAEWFGQAVQKRSSDALRKILKDGGISIEFQVTPAMRDITAASIAENVSLIRSIPSQYFTQVEGIVYRSVMAGRDIGGMTKELEERFVVTRRRAALIARDQNNKMTAAFSRARMIEAGIDEAQWVHSMGGTHKRPSHVKASKDKVRYPVAEGWLDPDVGQKIQPGFLIGCKCVGRPVIKGFS